jgi:23S rRNA pseudouridine2605 synthase
MVDHETKASAPEGEGQADWADAGERVAKALARAGVASRREVERYIAAGRVALNGRVLDTPAVKVGPGDVLTVDGQPVAAAEPTRVWRYHKPVGLVTSHKDPQGRPTVFEALPPGLPRVISVGRLDLNSEGLLILTNDGELARALELPSTGWVRRYRARAWGRASQAALDTLKDGVVVDGVAYGAIDAKLDKVQRKPGDTEASPANCWITVTLTEGKNREVRRVLEHLGLKVNRLVRLSYGPFALATLPVGAAEEVGPRVIREQLAAFIAPETLPMGARDVSGVLTASGRRPGGPLTIAAPAEPPARKTYKPGWARPAKPKGPPRPKATRPKTTRSGADRPTRATTKAPRPPGPKR